MPDLEGNKEFRKWLDEWRGKLRRRGLSEQTLRQDAIANTRRDRKTTGRARSKHNLRKVGGELVGNS